MDLERLTRLEYLGLDPDDARFAAGPFERRTETDLREPHLHVLRLMRNPDYFYFTAKHLFGVELFPFQCVLLKEMWTHRFPMLIGSRGMSKSTMLGLYALLRAVLIQGSKVVICGSGFRQAKTVFSYAENVWNKSSMLRSLFADDPQSGVTHGNDRWMMRLGDSTVTALPIGDGCISFSSNVLRQYEFGRIGDECGALRATRTASYVYGNGSFRFSDEAYRNGVRPTKIVTTAKGYRFEGTHNHRMKVVRGGCVSWVRADEMRAGDRILIDRSWRWHDGDLGVTDDQAYALGLMIGDGSYCGGGRLGFANQEGDLVGAVRRGTGYPFRGDTDGVHFTQCGWAEQDDWLGVWGMTSARSHEKVLPRKLLGSPRGVVSACLSGLFDTDGHVTVCTEKGGVGVTVTLTSTSEGLVDQVQFILLHYGIVSCKTFRDRDEKWNRCFSLMVSGPSVELFRKHVGFRRGYKKKALGDALASKKRNYASDDSVPGVKDVMVDVAGRNRTRRGSGTADTAAVSASQIARRKGITHDLARRFLGVYGHLNEPGLDAVRALADPDVYYDEVVSIEDGECETFDVHVPEGNEYCANGFFSHNSGIRGERANCIIADEFASLSEEIFETVISGFGVVNLSPVEQAKQRAKIRVMQRLGVLDESEAYEERRRADRGNQIILSGTAYYRFNHFYRYWQRWKAFVESKGDREWLLRHHGVEVDKDWDHRDYMVIRIPVGLLPDGLMELSQVGRARATIDSGRFTNEFEACYSSDSNGFFPRSLIETCVTNTPVTPAALGSTPVQFKPCMRGNPALSYVMGVDTAAESDNFAVVVLEAHETHRRVVYGWTTDKQRFRAKVNRQLAPEGDFYGYCARKIRALMRVFNCVVVAVDSQGGGQSGVVESLHDPDKMETGEKPVWPLTPDHPLSDGRSGLYDDQPGLHLVELVNFASAGYTSGANHGLRKDLEDRTLLFPMHDPVLLAEKAADDEAHRRVFDTFEDCVDEIEELKEELTTITISETPGTHREHWDTPETKLPGSRKGRMRKDRYSALLMANYAAHRLHRRLAPPDVVAYGGFADAIEAGGGEVWVHAPEWFTRQGGGNYEECGWV